MRNNLSVTTKFGSNTPGHAYYMLNLYKGKGEALDRGSHRGLKLTDQVMKLLEWIPDSYISKMVNIDEMQFGFVPGRGTTDTIFVVRQLKEKYIAANKQLLWLCRPWESLWFCAKEDPIVDLKEPLGQGAGCACHPGHVLQCPESCACQWSVEWGVWYGSLCASGFCP